MKCQVCSGEVSSGAAFCPKCGAKLVAVEPTNTARNVSASDSSASIPRPRGADVPEETLWEGSYSSRAMIGSYVIGGAISLVLLVIAIWQRDKPILWVALGGILLTWLYLFLKLAAARLGVHYKLTNHMFHHRKGLINRVNDRIELIEIHDVTYEQGPIERLVGVGRVKILSNDRTDATFYLQGIENVEQVAQTIDKARRAEQIRRGRRIESITAHES